MLPPRCGWRVLFIVVPQSWIKFPLRGRPGRVNGTRELVISPLPYIVVYRIRENFIEIAKVLHGAQRWP